MKAFVNLLIEDLEQQDAGDIGNHVKDLLSKAGVKVLWSKSKEAEERNLSGKSSQEPF
jgi:hypothetical protein